MKKSTKSAEAASNLPPDSTELKLKEVERRTPETSGKKVVESIRAVHRHTIGLMGNFQIMELVGNIADIKRPEDGFADRQVYDKKQMTMDSTGKLRQVPSRLIPGKTTVIN